MEGEKLLPDEQKGWRRQSKGTKNCKRSMKNSSGAWINYKNACGTVPHTWILQCLKIFKVTNNIRNVTEKSMKSWNVELTSGGYKLSEVKINRGIFQGDSLSPILFVITLIPPSLLLRDMKAGYMFGELRGKINHLLLMDDLKLYSKTIQELDSLVQAVRIFSSDTGMQFGISKCAMLEMKRGKVVQSKGIELPSGETK